MKFEESYLLGKVSSVLCAHQWHQREYTKVTLSEEQLENPSTNVL